MHRHCRHDAPRNRIGVVAVTPLLVREHQSFLCEGSIHAARGARRKPTHTIVGISTLTPRRTFAADRRLDAIDQPDIDLRIEERRVFRRDGCGVRRKLQAENVAHLNSEQVGGRRLEKEAVDLVNTRLCRFGSVSCPVRISTGRSFKCGTVAQRRRRTNS